MKSNSHRYLQIFVLGLAGASIYLIPYVRYAFYDFQIGAMGITNAQLGLLSTAYGIGAMIFYLPGGIIADKFSARKLITLGLASTTLFTLIYSLTLQQYILALIIWVVFSITSVLVFWAALMKAVRLCSSAKEQGFMFGLYYMIQGLAGALINAIGIWATSLSDNVGGKFFNVVIVYAFGTGIAAILVFFVLKENTTEAGAEDLEEKFHFAQVGAVLKNPMLWLLSIIVFCGYSIYTSTTYFTPYLTDVVGITPESSGILSIFRTNVAYIFAPLSGLVADKLFKSTSKWFVLLYFILTGLFIGIFLIPSTTSVGLISLYTLLPGIFGLSIYSINFSIMAELKIPAVIIGTAIGVASVIGYTPDLFLPAMFGSWLDKYGNTGYNYIFLYLTATCVVAIITAVIIRRNAVKTSKLENK